jgi:putative ABC transport system permease protein
MKLSHLVVREITHRKLNFALGLLSIMVASSCLVGAVLLLGADRIETRQKLSQTQEGVQADIDANEAKVASFGAELEDAMRVNMKKLGFNVLILPEDQDLSELHLDGTLSATMPESYVDRLAKSPIVTVRHLLPTVTRRVEWPEKEVEIVLHGTRGEVPIAHAGRKSPLLEAVAPGKMVIGYDLGQKLDLHVGEKVTLMGEEFEISTVHPQRGNADDDTVWIDLATAQRMLGMENLLNAIMALECECAGDRITQVRDEITGILPGTQVIERFSQALTRAETRAAAKSDAERDLEQARTTGVATMERVATGRRELEESHAKLAGVLVPLVIVAAIVLIGFLAFANARQRSAEIGILRAIGLKSRQIMIVFLGKAVCLGLLGGIIGCALGYGIGMALAGSAGSGQLFEASALKPTLIIVPLAAPLVAVLATWIPALAAAQRDPALVLQGE